MDTISPNNFPWSPPTSFPINQLNTILDHDMFQFRQQLYNFFKHPIFKPQYNLSVEEIRNLVFKQLEFVLKRNSIIHFSEYYKNTFKWLAFMDTLVLVHCPLSVKAGVHLSLFAPTIFGAGTKAQMNEYIDSISNLDIRAGFAMTELDHGSNVQDIQTTSTWDHKKRCFILNSPNSGSQKSYIGGVANHGTHLCVFANLIIKNKNHGVHIFVVPIRDVQTMQILPGIRIRDNGKKLGMNGVDNGRILFDNVIVPRNNLLSRYAQVDENGRYTSSFVSPSKRFGAMVSPLVSGRYGVSQGAISICKLMLIIAIRYATQRRQFISQSPDELYLSATQNTIPLETPILDYKTHQNRLYPLVAETFCWQLTCISLRCLFVKFIQTRDKQILLKLHMVSSGVKPLTTWHRGNVVEQCRQSCGAQGFMMRNQIASYYCDSNIDVTYEGDNTVLLLQMTKVLLFTVNKGIIKVDESDLKRPSALNLEKQKVVNLSQARKLELISFMIQVLKSRWTKQLLSLIQNCAKQCIKLEKKYIGQTQSQYWQKALLLNQTDSLSVAKSYTYWFSLNEAFQTLSKQNGRVFEEIFSMVWLWSLTLVEKDLGNLILLDCLPLSFAHKVCTLKQQHIDEIHSNRSIFGILASFGIPEWFIHAPIAHYPYEKEYSFQNGTFGNEIQPVNCIERRSIPRL